MAALPLIMGGKCRCLEGCIDERSCELHGPGKLGDGQPLAALTHPSAWKKNQSGDKLVSTASFDLTSGRLRHIYARSLS
eukprot:6456940-Amphidinium_carterae.1